MTRLQNSTAILVQYPDGSEESFSWLIIKTLFPLKGVAETLERGEVCHVHVGMVLTWSIASYKLSVLDHRNDPLP